MRKKLLTSILVLSMACSVISEHTAFAASVATQPAISTDSTETTDTIKDTDTTKNTNTQKSYSFKKNTFSYKGSSQSVSPLTNSTYTHAALTMRSCVSVIVVTAVPATCVPMLNSMNTFKGQSQPEFRLEFIIIQKQSLQMRQLQKPIIVLKR
mgnify:CR=1 FL=1